MGANEREEEETWDSWMALPYYLLVSVHAGHAGLLAIYAMRRTPYAIRGRTEGKRANARQFIESRGIHIIPYSYLQRRFKGANVRSLVRNNVAFKLSFGLTFALAAFAEF